jgi:hypothetical protein
MENNKVEKIFEYDKEKFKFVELIQDLFDCENLQFLHQKLDLNLEKFERPGVDSDTEIHKVFYDKLKSGWPEFENLYKKFIRNEAVKRTDITSEQLVFQRWPSFRIHLPNNVAVGGWHSDKEYNHPAGEVNFIVALTPMFESNTVITESAPKKRDFHQIEMNPGQYFRFNGNECTHGNLPNKTGLTRVSFDFRIMNFLDYKSDYELTSLSANKKFLIGAYYDVMNTKELS